MLPGKDVGTRSSTSKQLLLKCERYCTSEFSHCSSDNNWEADVDIFPSQCFSFNAASNVFSMCPGPVTVSGVHKCCRKFAGHCCLPAIVALFDFSFYFFIIAICAVVLIDFSFTFSSSILFFHLLNAHCCHLIGELTKHWLTFSHWYNAKQCTFDLHTLSAVLVYGACNAVHLPISIEKLIHGVMIVKVLLYPP